MIDDEKDNKPTQDQPAQPATPPKLTLDEYMAQLAADPAFDIVEGPARAS